VTAASATTGGARTETAQTRLVNWRDGWSGSLSHLMELVRRIWDVSYKAIFSTMDDVQIICPVF
jgi:hypothetical protein